jgi:hypothetical protein
MVDQVYGTSLTFQINCRSLYRIYYSLRSILVPTNVDVSKHILVIGTSILVESNMNRRDIKIFYIAQTSWWSSCEAFP